MLKTSSFGTSLKVLAHLVLRHLPYPDRGVEVAPWVLGGVGSAGGTWPSWVFWGRVVGSQGLRGVGGGGLGMGGGFGWGRRLKTWSGMSGCERWPQQGSGLRVEL